MPGIFRMVATAGPQGSAGPIDVFVADHIYAPVLVVRGTIERIRDDSGDVARVDGGVPACHARGSTSGFNGFSPRAGLDPARAGRAGWRSRMAQPDRSGESGWFPAAWVANSTGRLLSGHSRPAMNRVIAVRWASGCVGRPTAT